MGRGKIEIKRIDNQKNRRTTYVKRKNGIIKKAEQITKLCEAQVFLLIFGPCGKFDEFCSSKTTLADLLDNYQKIPDKPKLWDAKHENLSQEIERIKKENDSMKVQLRHLNGDDIGSMHYTELESIERVLENGLQIVRNKRVECSEMIENNTKILEDEYRNLRFLLQEQEMAMKEKQPTMKEYDADIDYSHMPYAFPILQHIK